MGGGAMERTIRAALLACLGALGPACDGRHGSDSPPAGGLRFAVASTSVAEAGGTALIAVSRTGGSAGAVGVTYATSNGSALAGSDYTATTGTLAWADGDAADKAFTVPVASDAAAEGDETVNLALSLPTGGAALGSPSTAVLTIADDDTPAAGALPFAAAATSVDEGAGSVTITVTRTGGSSGPAGVTYATSNGTATAGQDYTAAGPAQLSWAAGDASPRTFTVAITDDPIVEPGGDETINLTLSAPTGGAIVGTQGTAVVSIVDNDSAGTLQFASASHSASEAVGMAGAPITVTRAGGSSGAVSVQVALAGGTATSGQDYPIFIDWVASLSWPAGDSSPKSFSFPLLDDSVSEADETVVLSLQFPTGGAALGSPSSTTLTILDDDVSSPSGSLQFSSAATTFLEGVIPILPDQITVTRSGGSLGAVSVMVVVTGGSATQDVDYMIFIPGPLAGVVLWWADGETGPKSFTITILNDGIPEGNETIRFGLTNVTGGAQIGSPATLTATIVDDD